ncbi:hypothetical protein ACHHYP_02207 [Achlya hypogyna]|uniref:Kinesin motor domain-containing protein n=1 Tax=Achlya hypogyna TaxID=1202772 RepID=A0A1V9Z772_ACHHY|nr:hypothetical protein ACHHYP_02207 [Achlya hypogyna]
MRAVVKSHIEVHDRVGGVVQAFPLRKHHFTPGADLAARLRALHAPELHEVHAALPAAASAYVYLVRDDDGDWVQLDAADANADSLRLKLVVRPTLECPPHERRLSAPLPPVRMNALLTQADRVVVATRHHFSALAVDAAGILYWLDARQGALGTIDTTTGDVAVLLEGLHHPTHLALTRAGDVYFAQAGGDLWAYSPTARTFVCRCRGLIGAGGFDVSSGLETLVFVAPRLAGDAIYRVAALAAVHYQHGSDAPTPRSLFVVADEAREPTAIGVATGGVVCVAWSAGGLTLHRPVVASVDPSELWEYSDVVATVALPALRCEALQYFAATDMFHLGLADACNSGRSGGLASLAAHGPTELQVTADRSLPVIALAPCAAGVYYCAGKDCFQYYTYFFATDSDPTDSDPTDSNADVATSDPDSDCVAFDKDPAPASLPVQTPIQVIVRCRPLLPHEVAAGQRSVVACRGNSVFVEPVHAYQNPRGFAFDRVFGPTTTQQELFETSIRPLVQHALDGYKCTVLAYGPTGSGKTHSMQGSRPLCPGMMFESVAMVFAAAPSAHVRMSFVEIYNEELLDLLDESQRRLESAPPTSTSSRALQAAARRHGVRIKYKTKPPVAATDGVNDDEPPPKLHIVRHPRDGVIVHGLQEAPVASAADVYALLEAAIDCRQQSATRCNKESSRSHAIFTLYIDTTLIVGGNTVHATGQLRLVDLSGSENYARAGGCKARQVEAANIGQGLLALGRVIKALVEGWRHVPYRESKLTRLLQDSIGGATMTTLLLAVAPGDDSLDETLSTLAYAQLAQRVVNRPARTHVPVPPAVAVAVATPWEGHVPIRTSPPRLLRPPAPAVHATTLEWRNGLQVRPDALSRKTLATLKTIFARYDTKAAGVLARHEARKVYLELFGRPKDDAPKALLFADFVAAFQQLLATAPEVAQELITRHGFTLNLERRSPPDTLPSGVRGLRLLKQLRPASAPALRQPLHRSNIQV